MDTADVAAIAEDATELQQVDQATKCDGPKKQDDTETTASRKGSIRKDGLLKILSSSMMGKTWKEHLISLDSSGLMKRKPGSSVSTAVQCFWAAEINDVALVEVKDEFSICVALSNGNDFIFRNNSQEIAQDWTAAIKTISPKGRAEASAKAELEAKAEAEANTKAREEAAAKERAEAEAKAAAEADAEAKVAAEVAAKATAEADATAAADSSLKALHQSQSEQTMAKADRVASGNLSAREQQLVHVILSDLHERQVVAGWASQVKAKGKTGKATKNQARIVIVTRFRVITLKKSTFTRKNHSVLQVGTTWLMW
jgi:hypothetical protein